MTASERNTIVCGDYIDPDALLAVAAAEGVRAVFISSRPVVDQNHLHHLRHDPLYYQEEVSNERHLFNATRFVNDLHNADITDVPVFLGLDIGSPHTPVWGTYTYDGVEVVKTKLMTTIDHSVHLDERKHPLIPAPHGVVRPGTFREGLDLVMSLKDGFDTLLCGPSTEFAVISRLLTAKGLARRLGFLAVQGDFMELDESSLIFRMPFNYGCDRYAGDYVREEYPGPLCSVRSAITRGPGVSFSGDPADDYYDPALPPIDWASKPDKALDAMLTALGGDGLLPVFRRVYEVHRLESWLARHKDSPLGRPPAAPHDLHLAILLEQWREGRTSPYTWREVDSRRWRTKGGRYDVERVDSIEFFELARQALVRPPA